MLTAAMGPDVHTVSGILSILWLAVLQPSLCRSAFLSKLTKEQHFTRRVIFPSCTGVCVWIC